MAEYTKYQQKVIRNYYENAGQIALQRLQELCTELYLSEGKKLAKNWESVEKQMETLKVPKPRIDHLMKQKDPTLVAELVKQLMAKG